MRVTVVTVCFNAEKEIERTMRSVLDQSWGELEYIIIDGASKDNTIDIIKMIKTDYPFRDILIVSEPDNGIYDAMNKAIDLATGEWINFMNTGDYFVDRNVIQDVFSLAHDVQAPTDILYGDIIQHNRVGTYYKNCSNGNWCHQALFSRTSILKNAHFDLSFKIAADDNFVNNAIRNGSKMIYIPRVIAYFENEDGLSCRNKILLHKERLISRNKKKDVSWYLELLKIFLKLYIVDRVSFLRKLHDVKTVTYLENNPYYKRIANK